MTSSKKWIEFERIGTSGRNTHTLKGAIQQVRRATTHAVCQQTLRSSSDLRV